MNTYAIIKNRNSLKSQVSANNASATNTGFGNFGSASAVSTTSINTAADITVTITIQNATGSDPVSMEVFEILAIP